MYVHASTTFVLYEHSNANNLFYVRCEANIEHSVCANNLFYVLCESMRLIGTGTGREGSGRVAGLSSKKDLFETAELKLVKLKYILKPHK